MARTAVFLTDTRLWNAAEGWRIFPKGETDPGGAWSEFEGGAPARTATDEGVLKDLALAGAKIEALGRNLSAKDHDLAQMARERAEAVEALGAMEQRALAAERALVEAEDVARSLTRERDDARAQLSGRPVAEDVHDERTLDTAVERASVIPANWEVLPFFTKKALAAKLTDKPVKTKDDVNNAIRAHLALEAA